MRRLDEKGKLGEQIKQLLEYAALEKGKITYGMAVMRSVVFLKQKENS